MNCIEIIGNGIYLPKREVLNSEFNEKFKLDSDWIYKRTGIEKRYYVEKETIENMAVKASLEAIKNSKIDKENIDIIVVATTSTEKIMPGISFEIQKRLDIKKCMCLDVLAGCSGYINAFDIVRKYIALGEAKTGLVIGVEEISKYLDYEDINTAILLGDGAGATIIQGTEEKKIYSQYIESIAQDGDILTCHNNEKLYMDGKKIYKYGITKTVENIEKLLEKTNEKLDNIKYIVPHQSNIRILENMAKRLNISFDKMYTNLKNVGNTFCASIPIALNEMYEKNLLKKGDKIILIGYGGGLNLGSILIEI